MVSNRIKSITFALAILFVIFSLNTLFFEPDSKTSLAHADSYTKTFTFATTVENFTGYSSLSTLSYDSGTGNPAGALKTYLSGNKVAETSYWLWSGTWEDLGVPSGSIVTQVRINAGYTRATTWSKVDSVTIGPYKLRNSSGTDQATLWSGRSPSGVEGSWVAIAAQANQSVPSGIQSSDSSIQLYLERDIDLGTGAASATVYDDQLSFVITYNVAFAISITTDGSTPFGITALNSTKDTTSSGLNDPQTISVDIGPADLDARSSNFSDGSNTWTIASSNGTNQAKWEFSKDGTNWTTFTVANTLYTLDTNVAQSATRNVYLRLTTPTSTTSYNQHSATVTIVASAP